MLKTVIFYLQSINFLVYRCVAAETGRKPNIMLLMTMAMDVSAKRGQSVALPADPDELMRELTG